MFPYSIPKIDDLVTLVDGMVEVLLTDVLMKDVFPEVFTEEFTEEFVILVSVCFVQPKKRRLKKTMKRTKSEMAGIFFMAGYITKGI